MQSVASSGGPSDPEHAMSQFSTVPLLKTKTVTIRDIVCDGECQHKSDEECAHRTSLVYPYRGVFMRHVGRNDTVAEANQVLFFNAGQGYRISHPIEGGDACIDLAIDESMLEELTPKEQVQPGPPLPSAASADGSIRARRPWSLSCVMVSAATSPKRWKRRYWR